MQRVEKVPETVNRAPGWKKRSHLSAVCCALQTPKTSFLRALVIRVSLLTCRICFVLCNLTYLHSHVKDSDLRAWKKWHTLVPLVTASPVYEKHPKDVCMYVSEGSWVNAEYFIQNIKFCVVYPHVRYTVMQDRQGWAIKGGEGDAHIYIYIWLWPAYDNNQAYRKCMIANILLSFQHRRAPLALNMRTTFLIIPLRLQFKNSRFCSFVAKHKRYAVLMLSLCFRFLTFP